MTANQIRGLFLDNKRDECDIRLSDYLEITKSVPMSISMSNDGMDYIYSVNIIDLIEKGVEDSIIYNMVENGWILSKDRNKIVKIY